MILQYYVNVDMYSGQLLQHGMCPLSSVQFIALLDFA